MKEKHKVHSPKRHFLDSGAFTLLGKAIRYGEKHCCSPYRFYETKKFWRYMERYVDFVNRYKVAIDVCANVDVLPIREHDSESPDLSRRHLEWLEGQGLKPVPVVHLGTDLSVLRDYITDGYKFIGLGGLAGNHPLETKRRWIDKCFQMVCDTPDHTPMVKLHGFGVTNFFLLTGFPWFSVDSTTWTKVGAFGGVLVPKYNAGKFDPKLPPLVVKTALDSPDCRHRGLFDRHYTSMPKRQRELVDKWLEIIGIPLGEYEPDENGTTKGKLNRNYRVLSKGVLTFHEVRRKANLFYFEWLRDHIDPFPHPFTSNLCHGLGLDGTGGSIPKVPNPPRYKFRQRKVIIFYSGNGGLFRVDPEVSLGRKANIMLSYWKFHRLNKPDSRFQSIVDARKEANK